MTLSGDLDDVLSPLLAAFDAVLEDELTEELTDLYVSGADQMVKWGKGGTIVEAADPTGRIVIPADYEGPPRAKAINWARKHGAQLVTQMDEETKKQLAGVVAQGIKNKRGVDGIGRDIRKEIQQMSVYRGRMISRTETASALSQGSLDAMKDMGIEGKEWVWPGGECDICAENQAAGVIPVDQAFPSGDMAPPAHPNCECALAPARLTGAAAAAEEPIEPTTTFDPETATPVNYDVPLAHGATAKEEAQINAWQAKLTVQQKESVFNWTESGYKDIRGGQISGLMSKRTASELRMFEGALKTAPDYRLPVYRGLNNLPATEIQSLATAQDITLKAHTSFSGAKHTAFGFTDGYSHGVAAASKRIDSVLFEVRSGGQTIGKLIQPVEREVIVGKGQSFTVVSRDIIQYQKDRGRVLHLVLEPK